METSTLAPAVPTEVVDVLLKALDQADRPLTVAQLQRSVTGPFKRKPEQLRQLLEDLVSQGRVVRCPPYRSKAPRFWTRDPEQQGRTAILKALADGPCTRPELLKGLNLKVYGLSDEQSERVLTALRADGQVRELPPLVGARTPRLSTRLPQAHDYLADAFAKTVKQLVANVAKKLQRHGLSAGEVQQAAHALWPELVPAPGARAPETPPPTPAAPAPGDDAGTILLERMAQLQPDAPAGATVSLPELRRSLEFQFPGKDHFDRAVLRLAERQAVDLHRDDHATGRTEQERAEMVTDGQGNCYVGIVRRG